MMMFKPKGREPDFRNIEAVVQRQIPARPTLFELFLNNRLYKNLVGEENFVPKGRFAAPETVIRAYYNAGYDYATIRAGDFAFGTDEARRLKSKSLNDGFMITDRDSFDKFLWNNPEDYDYSCLEKAKEHMAPGMKLIVYGPDGVEENVIRLVGYENLCYMLYEDPELVSDIFECVGSRLLKYYKIVLEYDTVGAILSNDDWGFNTQTLLPPEAMRKYLFPWHKKIVEAGHAKGRPVLLHSCGYYNDIIEDVICDLKYDARHSYEDNIVPVEKAYEDLNGRIAVLGGIDVGFVANASEKEIFERSKTMLERSAQRGGYALGTGNSVPDYVPDSHYKAMISAAWNDRWEE